MNTNAIPTLICRDGTLESIEDQNPKKEVPDVLELEVNMDSVTREAHPIDQQVDPNTEFSKSVVNDMISGWNTERAKLQMTIRKLEKRNKKLELELLSNKKQIRKLLREKNNYVFRFQNERIHSLSI